MFFLAGFWYVASGSDPTRSPFPSSSLCALPSLTLVPWPGAVQEPPGAVLASFGPLPFGAGPGPEHL